MQESAVARVELDSSLCGGPGELIEDAICSVGSQ